MRLVGPNCLGVLNTEPDVAPQRHLRARRAAAAGGSRFASQSGAFGIAALAEAAGRGLGLSSFVSMGNKADLSANDLLEYWEQRRGRPTWSLLYLESFGNPRRFGRIARRVGRDASRSSRSRAGARAAGARAAASHTGALLAASRRRPSTRCSATPA